MKSVPANTDFIVIGAGVAGLRAAIELAPAGRVLVLAKKEHTESATHYAQGGVAAALSDEDEIGLHLQDTLNAGDGLCNEAAARVLVEEGPIRIEELIEWGTQFDRAGTKLAFTREGAHSRSRVLHAQGDSTGREILRALWEKAKTHSSIQLCESAFTMELLAEGDEVTGVSLIDEKSQLRSVRARAVLLATGGLGQVYSNTTNPAVATGDGVAMAFRAGAEISDMEFIQFHPTALHLKGAPRFLLSEALRGEGAYLRNSELVRFMPKYHAMAELAPRDVVARAITHELGRAPNAAVYLDLTHLGAQHLRTRFPRIYSTCMQYNVDITSELVPIRPAAHYAMGGVRTDLDGATSLPRLYAAGEVACTGVHGANRLASNSLLEGLVFGARAAKLMREDPALAATSAPVERPTTHNGDNTPAAELCAEVQSLMWKEAAIVRTAHGLKQARHELALIAKRLPQSTTRPACEVRNLHTCAELIVRSALARLESRGAHYRTDYPGHDDKFRRHSIIEHNAIRFE